MSVAVAAVASVGVSAYSSYSANKNAKRQAKLQGKAMDAQSAIAQQELDMAQEQYDYYKETYRPLEEEIVADAGLSSEEQEEMVAKAGLATQSAFESSDAARNRSLQRMGVNPNSGAYAESTRKSAISKAVAKANAQNTARATAEQMDYSQKVAAAGLGKGLTSSAANLMSSASGSYANQANAYGAMSQMYGQQAASSAQLGMRVAGAAMGSFGSYNDQGAFVPSSGGSFNGTQFGRGLLGVP